MNFDKEQFSLLKNGDLKTFENLYNEYKDSIYNYLMILTKNKDTANEIFSSTIYSAFKNIKKIKNDKNIYQWFMKIAKNRYYDFLRKKYKDDKIKNKLQENINHNLQSNDPFDIIDKKSKIDVVKLALKNIKPKYKKIIQYKYINGLSHKEIAAKLNKSIDASESLLQRSVTALRKELKKMSDYFE